MIKCSVEGNGKLLGLENASPFANENYNTNQLRVKNGKLLAYIQATERNGNIIVKFDSPYLNGTEVRFSIEPQ